MNYYLVQYDAEESIIDSTEVDILNYLTILNNVHYYDTKYHSNREEIKDWIESGRYNDEDLSITGDESEEDGFYTETMYLEIQIKE